MTNNKTLAVLTGVNVVGAAACISFYAMRARSDERRLELENTASRVQGRVVARNRDLQQMVESLETDLASVRSAGVLELAVEKRRASRELAEARALLSETRALLSETRARLGRFQSLQADAEQRADAAHQRTQELEQELAAERGRVPSV